ncbi:MAG: chemotaxis protein CheY, partial [Mycobacterium sp.]|nr:chemotaxis protein CheY [Mycobacterium sp.]
MKLATRLAILCGSALVAIILAAVLFTLQTARIADFYDQRAQARNAQVTSLEIGRDLQTFFATYNRLLFVDDPARGAELASSLDALDGAIENELRSAADGDGDGSVRMQYQQALTTWEDFRLDYRAELERFRNSGDAATSARDLDASMVLLENQIRQIEQEKLRAVEEANARAEQAIRTSQTIVWVFAAVIVAALGAMLLVTSRNIHRAVTRSAELSEKARISKEIQANLMTEVQGVADLAAAGGIIISRTAQALDAKHGALYLKQPDSEQAQEGARYALTASYAFHRRKGLPNSYGLGDGLVGQCALEANRIEVTGAPGDYVEIVSGLGKTEPVSLILIPIMFESEVLGVLELAGLRLFSEEDIELLESIALGAGVALSAIESAQKTRELLHVSQAQTEELQTQEEELRAANEQLAQREDLLSAQNAELEETTEELRSQQEELRAGAERLETQAQSLEQKNEELQRLSESL